MWQSSYTGSVSFFGYCLTKINALVLSVHYIQESATNVISIALLCSKLVCTSIKHLSYNEKPQVDLLLQLLFVVQQTCGMCKAQRCREKPNRYLT